MKKKLIVGSALTVAMCTSLIAGATMALFTSNTTANVAITSGNVQVNASVADASIYTKQLGASEYTQGLTGVSQDAVVSAEGGTVTLNNILPGDGVKLRIDIANPSSVAIKYRVKVVADGAIADNLLVGMSDTDDNITEIASDLEEYTYYTNYVSDWKSLAKQSPIAPVYLSVELPSYEKATAASGTVSFSVEAVQGNSDVTAETGSASVAHIVTAAEELASTVDVANEGDTVVLYEDVFKEAYLAYSYDENKALTLRGYGIGSLDVNAPRGTLHLYNDVNSLDVQAIADNSLHVYGNIGGSVTLESGRAVFEAGATVNTVTVNAADSQNMPAVEVKAQSNVGSVTVNASEGTAAKVVVTEDAVLPELNIQGNGTVDVENSGKVEETVVGDSAVMNNRVSSSSELKWALTNGSSSVILDKDISAFASDISVINNTGKEYVINLNKHNLTLLYGVLNIEGVGTSLTIKNGTLNANNTTYTTAAIVVNTDCKAVFEGLTVNATGTFLFPCGDAASAEVSGCTLNVQGVYAIGTNAATTDNYDVIIDVADTVINMESDDSCAVMINVAGVLNMNNVDISAHRQGIFVRAGTVDLTDVNVTAKIPYIDLEYPLNYANNPTKWKSGNEVPYGALVVGNQLDTAYKADAEVTVSGGRYICTAADQRVAERASALYAIKGTTAYGTSVTVSNGTVFDGKIVNYNNTATLSGLGGKTIITALVASSQELKAIGEIVRTKADTNYYFQLIDNIEFSESITKFCGTLDGNGYKLTRKAGSANGGVMGLIYGISGHTTIKNVDLYMSDPTTILFEADWGTAYGVDFIDVTTNSEVGTIKCNINNFGFFIIEALYTSGGGTVTYNFIDCVNNVSIENEGTCTGVFVGSGPCANGTLIIKYKNCVNNGNITGTQTIGYLYGNNAYIGTMNQPQYPHSAINVENCKNNGKIVVVSDFGTVSVAPGYDKISNNIITGEGRLGKVNALDDVKYKVNQNGTNYSINTDNTDLTYKLAFNVASTFFTKGGEAWEAKHTEDIKKDINDRTLTEESNGLKYLINLSVDTSAEGALKTVRAYDIRTVVAKGVLTEDEVNALQFGGEKYVLVDNGDSVVMVFNVPENYYINSSVSYLLYAYDSNGLLVGVKNVK